MGELLPGSFEGRVCMLVDSAVNIYSAVSMSGLGAYPNYIPGGWSRLSALRRSGKLSASICDYPAGRSYSIVVLSLGGLVGRYYSKLEVGR